MKVFFTISTVILASFLTCAAQAQTSTVVESTFDGMPIYVGSGSPDLPADLHGALADLVCKAKGFESSDHMTSKNLTLSEPTEVAVPIDRGNNWALRPYTLQPNNTPSIAVIEELTCWTKH